MDLISDNFISYDDDTNFIVKEEKLSDSEVSFQPNEPQEPSAFFLSFPRLRSMLDSAELTVKESFDMNTEVLGKRRKPFKIIRDSTIKREETEAEGDDDPIKVKLEPEKKIFNNSKRDFRREVAKKKILKKSETTSSISSADQKLLTENFGNLNVDEKTRKKMLQMIRNRISAQNSRDRRKCYVQTLEYSKKLLNEQNNKLQEEKNKLMQEIKKLQRANNKLLEENKAILVQNGVTESESNDSAGLNEMPFVERLDNLGQLSTDFTVNDKLQIPTNVGNASLSIGLMLSMLLNNKINQQEGSGSFDGTESTKVDSVNDKTEVSSSGWEENNNEFIRKLSQSTMYSSFSSPTPDTAATTDKTHKLTFWEEPMRRPDTMMDILANDDGDNDRLFGNHNFVKLHAININEKSRGIKKAGLFGEGPLSAKGDEFSVFKKSVL